jgi:hypothetical protein
LTKQNIFGKNIISFLKKRNYQKLTIEILVNKFSVKFSQKFSDRNIQQFSAKISQQFLAEIFNQFCRTKINENKIFSLINLSAKTRRIRLFDEYFPQNRIADASGFSFRSQRFRRNLSEIFPKQIFGKNFSTKPKVWDLRHLLPTIVKTKRHGLILLRK